MRIVHVEDYFDPNAGYQINEFIHSNTPGLEQVVITSIDMSPFHKKYKVEDDKKLEKTHSVKIIRLKPLLKISSRLWLKNLWKTIESFNPDILFLHGIGDIKDLVLWKKKKKYIIVRDCHMSWVASINPLARYFYKFYSLFFTPFINNSNKYTKVFALGIEEYQYLKALGIKDEKIEMLPHGYNKNMFYFDKLEREKIRKKLNLNEKNILISYIGKFNKSKRPDLLFDILTENIMKKYPIKILFMGQKESKYMKDLFYPKLKTKNYASSVIIEESKPFKELRKWYSASDICIWPKQTTLSSIHAQVCGATVIMEDHLSNRERVIEKNNLFEKNNLLDATKILERILANEEYVREKEIVLNEELLKREYQNQIYTLRSLLKNHES